MKNIDLIKNKSEKYVNNFQFEIAHPKKAVKNAFVNGAKFGVNISFTNEEVIEIIQKRLLSIGVFSSYSATEIWFNQYKK